MNNEREIDIDLGRIFRMLKRRIVYIILGTIVMAVLAGCFTEFFITPKYSTSCTLYVYSNTDRISSNSSISGSEISASQQLASSYMVVIQSRTVMSKVIEDLELNMSTGQLGSMISCSQVNESEFIRVTVTSTDPQLAADIANSIARVAPDEIVRVVKAGGVNVLDEALVPGGPSSPNMKKNVLFGMIVGFALTFAGFFLYELFDTTVASEKDLEREFDIPLLGSIPRLLPIRDDSAPAEEEPMPEKILKAKGGK